jgi:hypothetical protein
VESPEVRNPFALLTNPDVVVKAMESSERLSRLRSRICRPLDRLADQAPGTMLRDADGDETDTAAEETALPLPQA